MSAFGYFKILNGPNYLFYPILLSRFIRCWDAKRAYELYRITAGLGGLGSGTELCVWSLLALRYIMG